MYGYKCTCQRGNAYIELSALAISVLEQPAVHVGIRLAARDSIVIVPKANAITNISSGDDALIKLEPKLKNKTNTNVARQVAVVADCNQFVCSSAGTLDGKKRYV
jgi:hypothetical protein